MEIQNACWDAPDDRDYTREDVYFGTEKTLPKIVDHRRIGTVYNQFVNKDTKMACGSYWVIHADNICELLDGQQEVNPRGHRLEFVRLHKKPWYDPIVKWSSLQDQLNFAEKVWVIWGFYRVKTKEEIMEGMANWCKFYTGSSKVDREATKKSKDNVMVISKWPWHIVCGEWYDEQYIFIRNSGALQHMRLRREDVWAMFSMYMIVPKTKASILDKVKANIKKKKETMNYYILKWPIVKWPKWILKEEPLIKENNQLFIMYEGKKHEVLNAEKFL